MVEASWFSLSSGLRDRYAKLASLAPGTTLTYSAFDALPRGYSVIYHELAGDLARRNGHLPRLHSRGEGSPSRAAIKSIMQPGGGTALPLAPPPRRSDDDEDSAPHSPQTRRSDDDKDSEAGSNFSTTEAEEQKKMRAHNRIANQLPSVPLIVDYEEQDEEDLQTMIEERAGGKSKRAGGKGKGKEKEKNPDEPGSSAGGNGKGKEKEKNAESGSGSGADSGDGDDEEEDEEDSSETPWDLTPGPLSKADLEAALAARRTYHAAINSVARQAGKRESAVFKAVGDHTGASRQTNPWNAFQVKWRAENPKSSARKSFFLTLFAYWY